MVATVSRETIEAYISGDVSGQVAVGSNNLQIGSIHGGVVNVAVPGQQPVPRLRPASALRPPKVPTQLLGREAQVSRVLAILASELPAEVHGQPGIGKTLLLKHLANHPDVPLPHVAYLRVRRQPLDDVLQSLFEAFYEWDGDVAVKPVGGQLRHHLAQARALVVLDDVDLEREDVQEVLGVAPRCVFLLASEECCLFGEGRAFALRGLPEDAALALLVNELERPLGAHEDGAARALCRALEGRPLDILQAAALARDEERSLVEVMAELHPDSAPDALSAQVATSLSEGERQVLGSLAALEGTALHIDHVAALTDHPDVAVVLESLARRGLVQAHSPSYSLTAPLTPAVAETVLPDQWVDRELTYFSELAERHRHDPGRLVEDREAILAALDAGTQRRHWDRVIRLARAADPVLCVSGRWGGWERALDQALRAARAVGDRAAEAWSLHQLGTRALCLGDSEAAKAWLGEAVRLRQALGDPQGSAVTRYHLDVATGRPPPPPQPPSRPPQPPPRPPVPRPSTLAALLPTPLVVVGAALLLAVGSVGGLLLLSGDRGASTGDLLRVEPSRLSFAGVGTVQTVTVFNRAASAVTVSEVTLSDAADFRLVADQCTAARLLPGSSCTVSVGFHPSGPGTGRGSLAIRAANGRSPLLVPMVGAVVEVGGLVIERAAAATADPPELEFADQAVASTSPPKLVTVVNSDPLPLRIDGVAVTGAHSGDFSIREDGCTGSSLPAGARCTLSVAFAPQAPGARGATLAVSHGGVGSPLAVPLSGRGIGGVPPGALLLRADPRRLDFGSHAVGGRSGPRTVTVTNTGIESLGIGTVAVSGANQGDFSLAPDGCGGRTLAAGGSCTVAVSFAPRGTGARQATLGVDYRGGTLIVPLAGRGSATSRSTAAPDLTSASVETATGTVAYTFDTTLSAAPGGPRAFHLYDVTGTQHTATSVRVSGTRALAQFSVAQVGRATVATAEHGAVVDAAGRPNPTCAAPLQAVDQATSGATSAPDLLGVRPGPLVGGLQSFFFDFDQPVNTGLGAHAPAFEVVAADNTSYPGTAQVSATDMSLQVAFSIDVPASEIVRGIAGTGAVTSDARVPVPNPLQSEPVAGATTPNTTTAPDLTGAFAVGPGRVRYTFDAPVTATDPGLFRVYGADGAETRGSAMAPVPGEATAMEVSFTPATPVAAAVGASVEGGAARAATGSPQESEDASVLVQVPAGRTALPDLVRVVRSADGSGRPVVTFVFDQALPPAYQEGPPPGADFSLYDGDGRRHGARGRGTVGGGGAEVTFGIPSVDEAVLATAVVGAVDDVGGDAPTFPEGCAPLT